LLSSYSALTVVDNGTSSTTGQTSTTSYALTESYTTVYASSTTYKVNVSESEAGSPGISYLVYVLKSGTIAAVTISVSGYTQNVTGSQAQEEGVGIFAGFTLAVQFDSQISYYTYSSFFHSTGTSTVNIGPTSVKVTTYAANTLPETVTECGVTTSLTAFSFSVGTPSGATEPLVTSAHIAGNSDGSTYDTYITVTSVTLA
jgi:hypothetical protein